MSADEWTGIDDQSARPAVFPTTHWSEVLAAGDKHSPQADEALTALCQAYWYPIYAYLRRAGHAPADAQDVVQGFFAHLLQNRCLAGVKPDRGKFRSFLLKALRNYLTDEARRQRPKTRRRRHLDPPGIRRGGGTVSH